MVQDIERNERIVRKLKQSGLDAFVCTSPSSVLLLTGYWPVMGASVAIFSAQGDVRVILPEDEGGIAQAATSATQIAYKPASLKNLASPIEPLGKALKGALEDMKLSEARLALETAMDMQPITYSASFQFRCSTVDLLRNLVPKAKLTSCEPELAELGAVKTAGELEKIRRSAHIAADGFLAASQAIRPGIREAEAAAAIHEAFMASPGAEGVIRSYGFFFCMSGPNSAKASGAFAHTQQRVLQEGDLVLVHCNTCADGYWTDITRTYTLGDPTERDRQIRAAVQEARRSAIRAIVPGADASEIDRAARNVMESHGLGSAFHHSTGHGVGFAAANPNALPRLHPASPDVLQEGMTFNVEPAAYFDGYGGMRHCDMIALTAGGPEMLTDF